VYNYFAHASNDVLAHELMNTTTVSI